MIGGEMRKTLKLRTIAAALIMIVAISTGLSVTANAQGITQEIARANFLKSLPNFRLSAKTIIGRDKTESELSQLFNGLFAIKHQMKKVISLAEASAYLKEHLAKPENTSLRREVIENIIWDARGRMPDKTEYQAYDAVLKMQKTWYIKELNDQSKFLKDPAYVSEKNKMVNLAYKSALCRDARPDELKASTTSLYVNEIFSLRELIWSPNYTALRNETIKLWWQSKFNKTPSPANIQSAVDAFGPVKAICSEMSKRWDLTDIK
jgi:hypothetical protein